MNPRRPTPSGPEPDPFDLARAPPRPVGVGVFFHGVWFLVGGGLL